jgi:glucosamine-6-phosphate deaminase
MVTALEVGKPLAYGKAKVQIFESQRDLGMAAARGAAERIERAIRERGNARVMIATGNSQLDVSAALVDDASIDWKRVDIFHMDEYVGLSAEHPASFRKWIKERVEDRVHPASASYIDGDAEDIGAELARYTKLLQEGPIDVAFVGFGENGHIAFNDPAMADFFDPLMVKCVDLDADCRAQQVHEGHFESVEDVPSQALSVSCSGLLRASSWICCVPEGRKAQAVHRALNGPISIACPASIVRLHRDASVYLDQDSAALLDQPSLQD